MVEILVNKIIIHNLDSLCYCSLFNYGKIKDYCNKFSCEFEKGKVYGIIGEFGNGGWALSYTLAGRHTDFTGTICIDEKPVNAEVLKKVSCYVGEGDSTRSAMGFRKLTVAEQINRGIKDGKCPNKSIEEVVRIFNLSPERIERRIEHVGNERWKASIAIGYSMGKKIFCFPWLNTGEITFLMEHIKPCIDILKETDSIVIIPTCREDSIKDITSETIYIKGLYEKMLVDNESI